jgi:hypothetical protein
MAKYKITEAQMQKIFEAIESKKITEFVDNYPPGSDTSSAPWNQNEPKTSKAITSDGNFELVGNTFASFLIRNKENNQLYYTDIDAWEGLSGTNKWSDIKDELFDFLEVPEESVEDEDGRSMAPVEDWKDSINSDDLADALVNYMNYNTSRNNDINIVNSEEWQDGNGKFVIINSDNINDITNGSLKEKAIAFLK